MADRAVMLLWLYRVWLLASRGQLDDDPVIFAIRDVVSLAIVWRLRFWRYSLQFETLWLLAAASLHPLGRPFRLIQTGCVSNRTLATLPPHSEALD